MSGWNRLIIVISHNFKCIKFNKSFLFVWGSAGGLAADRYQVLIPVWIQVSKVLCVSFTPAWINRRFCFARLKYDTISNMTACRGRHREAAGFQVRWACWKHSTWLSLVSWHGICSGSPAESQLKTNCRQASSFSSLVFQTQK